MIDSKRIYKRPHHLKALLLLLLLVALASPIKAQSPTSGGADAEVELKRGNYEAAIAGFRARLTANASDEHAQAGMMRAHYETGRDQEAEASAVKFLLKKPDAYRVRHALGEIYAMTGRYAQAVAEFERAAKGLSGAADSIGAFESEFRRAETLFLIGQEEAAKQTFMGIVNFVEEKNSQDARSLTLIAKAQTYLERYKEASELYLKAIAADPSHLDAHVGGGELFTEKYNYAEAADFFQDALKINARSVRAYVGTAANKKLEGGAEMQAALSRALEINPRVVEAYVLRAGSLMEAGRYDAAALALDEAQKVNPNSLDALALRAALLYLQDRDFEATLKSALAINHRYGKLYDTLAYFATITRRYHQSVRFAQQAVALSPRLWRAHLNLGMALMRTGRMAEGRAAIEVAFAGDPFNLWAKNTLDMLDAIKDYKETQAGDFVFKVAASEHDALQVYAANLLQEAAAKLNAKYQFTPQGPLHVELFPNHEDFAVRALGLPGLGALGVCFGQVIALDSPSARSVGEFNWGSTLWHEYVHVITLQMTEYRIPRWFSEGLSVYEERRGRPAGVMNGAR
ncbi:MAG: tetratricopeptide repeat protein [Pyrinomonadaceae bacterium]